MQIESCACLKDTLRYFTLLILFTIVVLFGTLSLRRFQHPSPIYASLKNEPNFTSVELNLLRSMGRLFLLNVLRGKGNEIWFASLDIRILIADGRLRVFPMEKIPSKDYVKFYLYNEIRAIHGLRTMNILYGGIKMVAPRDVDLFRWKWQSARFLDCQGLEMSEQAVRPFIPKSFVNHMAHFRNLIERYGSHPFLFGGTLLGWYRECSFINDTTDVDFAMRIDELNSAMLEELQMLHSPKLYWILGSINDSLELSVYADRIKIDLFFVFHDGENDWVGGMDVGTRRKLRWTYPRINDLCVGDLHNRLFNVPCNVEQILRADYGNNWRIHHKNSEFFWRTSHKNVRNGAKWKNSEWRSVYRIF